MSLIMRAVGKHASEKYADRHANHRTTEKYELGQGAPQIGSMVAQVRPNERGTTIRALTRAIPSPTTIRKY